MVSVGSHVLIESELYFDVLGVGVLVRFTDESIGALLQATYGAFLSPVIPVSLTYVIAKKTADQGYEINSYALKDAPPRNESDLIYSFEKDIELELQRIRAELLFIHAAALLYKDKAIILMAPSGSGKSTLTWGLLHHDFAYMSDELAPINLTTLKVDAYPHALCLKAEPPSAYPLPEGALRLGRTIHTPVRCLPAKLNLGSYDIAAILLVKYHAELSLPVIREMSSGAAAMQLYNNSLNQLAHPNHGLAAVAQVVEHVKAYEIQTTRDLNACAELIINLLEQV